MEPTLDNLLLSEMDRLYRYAFNQTHDPYLSEDIVQDIVVQCYRSYPRLRDKSRMQAWLWGIARNMVLRSFKGRKELPADEIMIISLAGVSYETPETELIHKEEIAYLRRSLSYLAKNYREVCVLYYLEGKDYQTIADTLGIPLSSVKWRLNQSKEQIKKEFTKMEYMNKGYRKAIPLKLDMTGHYVLNNDAKDGPYDGADRVLDNLLAQNICIVAYEQAKNVTEIASELGVSADFIEDTLERLIKVQAISQISDRYRATFPILSAQAMEDIMGGNKELARAKAGEIFKGIYGLEAEIRKVGFLGSDREMDRLLMMLLRTAIRDIDNRYDEDSIPFHGLNENSWSILATTGQKSKDDYITCSKDIIWHQGIGTYEEYFTQPDIPDERLISDAEKKAFVSIYRGKTPKDQEALSLLIEKGKIVKDGENFRIAILTLCDEEEKAIKRILEPITRIADDLQKQIYDRTYKLLKKYLPSHLQGQIEYFLGLLGMSVIESALVDEYIDRGLPVDRDSMNLTIVKDPVGHIVTVELEDDVYEELLRTNPKALEDKYDMQTLVRENTKI